MAMNAINLLSLLLLDINQYATFVNSEHVMQIFDFFGNLVSHIATLIKLDMLKMTQMCATAIETLTYVLRFHKGRILVEIK